MNLPAVMLSIFFVILIILSVYVFFALRGPDHTKIYLQRLLEGTIKNPLLESSVFSMNNSSANPAEFSPEEITSITQPETGDLRTLSQEEEIEFLNYLLVKFKVYNLHDIPFTQDTPKIQIYLEDRAYYAEIIQGEINIEVGGETKARDVTIRIPFEEAFEISLDEKTLEESVNSGISEIEPVVDNNTLFLKGYLNVFSYLLG